MIGYMSRHKAYFHTIISIKVNSIQKEIDLLIGIKVYIYSQVNNQSDFRYKSPNNLFLLCFLKKSLIKMIFLSFSSFYLQQLTIMEPNIFIFILFALVPIISQQQIYNKVLLDDPAALCLDGSPGAYYVSEGSQPDKFLLFFAGGGWCGAETLEKTYESCYERSQTHLGSSKNYPDTIPISQGVFSNSELNKFKTMTRVLLKYCDGSGHQGSRAQPLNYKDTKLYFRGTNITLAQLDSLQQKFGLFSKSSVVIVSGASAGGLASFLWTQYVADHVKFANVYTISDAGIFLDEMDYESQKYKYRQSFKNLFQISNAEINPPTPNCVKKFHSARHMCMFAHNIFQEIKVPIFIIQSLYDSWSLQNIVGLTCIKMNFFTHCLSKQRQKIQEYHRKTASTILEMMRIPENGCWAPACVDHSYMQKNSFYSSNYRIPMNSEVSIVDAIWRWMQNVTNYHRHMDTEKWPSNGGCSRVDALKSD